jgi:tRNA(adenine34) deaminase
MLNDGQKYDNIIRYMEKMMKEALEEAQLALNMGEVPIGAVIEKDGEIVGRGHNRTESSKDPTAHAEILAIQDAAKNLGGWRLLGCTLYVTTEPCSMCAGAIILARLTKVVIGTRDSKAGACGTVLDVTGNPKLNHHPVVEFGMMEEQCRSMMQDFFITLRNKKSEDTIL